MGIGSARPGTQTENSILQCGRSAVAPPRTSAVAQFVQIERLPKLRSGLRCLVPIRTGDLYLKGSAIRASAHPREHLQSNHARDQPRCGIFPLISIGGPGRDRTDDLFHAMDARSQTAPQAHVLRGCNFSILAGAGPIRQSSRALDSLSLESWLSG